MDYQDIRTLQLLEEIEQNHNPSQRYLAARLNVSLGLVNSFIKRLAKKGYFKITTIPKNRVKYIITPKGIAEKTKLTYEYINFSYQIYKDARKKLAFIFQEMVQDGVRTVIFYGVSQFAEIAHISLNETPIEIVGIVDQTKAGTTFLGMKVYSDIDLDSLTFDRVLITADDRTETIVENLLSHHVSQNQIVRF